MKWEKLCEWGIWWPGEQQGIDSESPFQHNQIDVSEVRKGEHRQAMREQKMGGEPNVEVERTIKRKRKIRMTENRTYVTLFSTKSSFEFSGYREKPRMDFEQSESCCMLPFHYCCLTATILCHRFHTLPVWVQPPRRGVNSVCVAVFVCVCVVLQFTFCCLFQHQTL